MKAVVLAAGEGTRMRPLTATRPKPMLPVAGRPLLEHVLDACAPHVDGYVLVVGYHEHAVREHFGDVHAGHPIEYATQEKQLGTGHAFGLAAGLVDEPFLALNGDVLVDASLVGALVDAGGAAMAVKRVDEPSAYGVVSHDGTAVTAIVEKPANPPSNLANLGVYVLPPAVFEHLAAADLSPRGEYEVTDALQGLVDAGERVAFVEHDGPWLDVGRPWELLDATEVLLDDLEGRVDGEVSGNATLEGPVVVESGAAIREGVTVEGPVVVEAGADVGPNAYLRGATVLGPDAHVGHGVEVKNSILMDGATVPHLSYVGDSVLGRNVNFGAGTTVANLRHDGANVRMRVKGEPVDTGRRKLGVVVADGVKTAIHTTLNAGVVLGVGATTVPDETVRKDKGRGVQSGVSE